MANDKALFTQGKRLKRKRERGTERVENKKRERERGTGRERERERERERGGDRAAVLLTGGSTARLFEGSPGQNVL